MVPSNTGRELSTNPVAISRSASGGTRIPWRNIMDYTSDIVAAAKPLLQYRFIKPQDSRPSASAMGYSHRIRGKLSSSIARRRSSHFKKMAKKLDSLNNSQKKL